MTKSMIGGREIDSIADNTKAPDIDYYRSVKELFMERDIFKYSSGLL